MLGFSAISESAISSVPNEQAYVTAPVYCPAIDPIGSFAIGDIGVYDCIGLFGSTSKTLGSLTSSSAGKLFIQASLSKTLGALTSVSAGVLPIIGTESKTLGALTVVSTGKLYIVGTTNKTLQALTLSSAGSLVSRTKIIVIS